MKNIYWALLMIVIVAALIPLSGCAKPMHYGLALSVVERTNIADILTDAMSYEGKTVKIEGSIVDECPTGCWFDLKDDTGMIYVDTNPSGFAIPQKVGHAATVEGIIQTRSAKTMLLATGVEIR